MPKSVRLSQAREPRLDGSRYRNMRCTTRQRDVSIFWRHKFCNTEFRACGRNDCVKQRHPLGTAKIGPIIHHSSETCKRGRKLLLFTHSKSHTYCPLVPESVTLNDLERHNGRYFALFRGTRLLPRTHPRKILATPMYLINNEASRHCR